MNDTVTVTFSDGSTGEDSRVKEDGTITLHFNQTFVAAGKTPLELRRDIYDRYAPKSTSPPHLTVSVRTDDLYYTITGELPEPVRVQWLGPVTVFQALHDAGLLDEHLKQRVILIRSNGRRLVVNFVKAIEDQRLDPHVLPGDTIHLPRRGL
jgi:protein involved in polysaccharide export with SLBB domain